VFYGTKKYQSCIDNLKDNSSKTEADEALTVSVLQNKMNSPEQARVNSPRLDSPLHSVPEEPMSTDRQRLTKPVGSFTGKKYARNSHRVKPNPEIPNPILGKINRGLT
jgi:hypothetical protein